MKNTAYEHQTITYTHARLPIDLGNLSGPAGNAFQIMANISGYLKPRCYKKEQSELSELIFKISPNYNKSFDKIAFYLDLKPEPKPIDLNALIMEQSERDDEVVFKISKKDLLTRQQEVDDYEYNCNLENYWKPHRVEKTLKQMNWDIEDISETNNLGRHLLFYIESLEDFKKIEQNLLDQGLDHKDIEKWVSQPDVGGMRAMDTLLWVSPEEARLVRKRTELMLYCATTYPSSFSLKDTNTFGLNGLTGILFMSKYVSHIMKSEKSATDKLEFLLDFQQLSIQIKKLPSYKAALTQNEDLFKLKDKEAKKANTFLLNCSDLESELKAGSGYSSESKELFTAYQKIKAQREKTFLEQTIHAADESLDNKPAFKI